MLKSIIVYRQSEDSVKYDPFAFEAFVLHE
jgi:hypothetical protein